MHNDGLKAGNMNNDNRTYKLKAGDSSSLAKGTFQKQAAQSQLTWLSKQAHAVRPTKASVRRARKLHRQNRQGGRR